MELFVLFIMDATTCNVAGIYESYDCAYFEVEDEESYYIGKMKLNGIVHYPKYDDWKIR